MKKYQIIYADPPWQYDDPRGNDPRLGGITYPTMPDDAIYKLPVSQIADRNCILFLWATMPKLIEAFKTIENWGFRYITCAFVWVKQNPRNDYKHPELFYPGDKEAFNIYSGMGSWTNGNAELCLLAKRGAPKRISKNIKQIILAPRSRHSEKPKEARERIVQLMGGGTRIELFARQKVEGWDAWGNEIESDIKLTVKESI